MEKESKTVDTLVPTDWKPEAEKIAKFVEELGDDRKEQLLSFIQGARFALSLKDKAM